MYAIRSYYGSYLGATFMTLLPVLLTNLGRAVKSSFPAIDSILPFIQQGRITSYNVCYTKLLRFNLRFGDASSMIECIWRTAFRAGIGADLALGSKELSKKYGAPEFSMAVKGMELPAYDPRPIQGIGLRITSYNVCYTKLLRLATPAARGANRPRPGSPGRPPQSEPSGRFSTGYPGECVLSRVRPGP